MTRRVRARPATRAIGPVAWSQRASQDAAAKASRDSIATGCVHQFGVRGDRFAFATVSDRARTERLLGGLHSASSFDRPSMTWRVPSWNARKQSIPAIARCRFSMALPLAYPGPATYSESIQLLIRLACPFRGLVDATRPTDIGLAANVRDVGHHPSTIAATVCRLARVRLRLRAAGRPDFRCCRR